MEAASLMKMVEIEEASVAEPRNGNRKLKNILKAIGLLLVLLLTVAVAIGFWIAVNKDGEAKQRLQNGEGMVKQSTEAPEKGNWKKREVQPSETKKLVRFARALDKNSGKMLNEEGEKIRRERIFFRFDPFKEKKERKLDVFWFYIKDGDI